MEKKYVFVERICECGCGEEIGLRRSDRAKIAKVKTGHRINKREILFIDKPCACGCGEVIGNWKYRPERKPPKLKQGHQYKYFYKGGKRIDKNGYVVLRNPTSKGGAVFEHRFVMEQHLNRKLESEEHVHHKNGIKTDNRIENLEILDASEHARLHSLERPIRPRKLNEDDIVRLINGRKQGKTFKELGEVFGVCQATAFTYFKCYEQGFRDCEKQAQREILKFAHRGR